MRYKPLPKLNAFSAILQAAQHLENHPEDYAFTQVQTPDADHTTGDCVSWIAFYMGLPNVRILPRLLANKSYFDFEEAYINPTFMGFEVPTMNHAPTAARALREAAAKLRAEGKI